MDKLYKGVAKLKVHEQFTHLCSKDVEELAREAEP